MNGPRVIATGGEWPAGLALLRGLRAAGYAPIAALVDADAAPARWSRAPVAKITVPDPAADAEGHAAGLARAGAEHAAAAVLPGTEASLLAVAEHGHLFAATTAVGSPPLEVVRAAIDKVALPEFARRAGLSTPPTYDVESGERFTGTYPAMVKPPAGVVGDGEGVRRRIEVRLVHDATELSAALSALPEGGGLVQPYLEANLRTVNGVAADGRVVCWVHKRSERVWPPEGGLFAYGATVAPDVELEAGCARLLADLRWTGIFNLQFLETEDGEHLLIDVNPRAYHSMALAIAAGSNLPGVWCDVLTGRPPRPTRARVGIRFRSEEDDLRALRAMASVEGIGAALRRMLPWPRTAHALFDTRDPLPLLHGIRKALEPAVRRRG